MSRSILNHQVFRGNDVQAVIIAIHGFAEDLSDALELVKCVSEDILAYAPGAPRPVSPRFSASQPANRAKLWYFEQNGVIEPSLFGDSLRQLEALLLDVAEEALPELPEDTPLYLLGRNQGATLALTLASLWPELVDGVLSVDGSIPQIPGWEEPGGNLTDRKVALIDTSSGARNAEKQAVTSAKLKEHGADVRTRECDESTLAEALRECFAWLRT